MPGLSSQNAGQRAPNPGTLSDHTAGLAAPNPGILSAPTAGLADLKALALGALDAIGEGGSNEANFDVYKGLLDKIDEFEEEFAQD